MKKYVKPKLETAELADIILTSGVNHLPTEGKSNISGATADFNNEWIELITK